MQKIVQIPVNDVYMPSVQCTDRYMYLFGGRGSGKSDYGVFKKLLRLQCESNHKFLFLRKVKNTLKESLFAMTENVINRDFGNYKDFEINKTDKSFKFLPNGNRIIMSGIDERQKLKSMQGITGVLIEEITELEEEDFLLIDATLRKSSGNYKQLIAMFNPIDEEHWLKMYVEPDDRKLHYLDFSDLIDVDHDRKIWRFCDAGKKSKGLCTTVFNTTFEDNFFLDDEYESVLDRNQKDLRVNKHGRWGRRVNDNPAWSGFSEPMVTETAKFNPEKGIHLTYDQNGKPYFTCLAIHIYPVIKNQHYEIHVFDEICTTPPNATAMNNAKEFKKRYPLSGLKGFVTMYGDRSMNVGSTLAKAGETGLTQVKAELLEYLFRDGRSDRVLKSNPSVSLRTEFANQLMAGLIVHGLRLDVKINPKCVNFLTDLREQRKDADGKPTKPKMKDENGDTYEKYGHCADAWGYFLVEAFALWWQKFTGKRN